jgi:cold shock CspA family protein
MSESNIPGTIASFDPVKGFGVISTDDGRELRFDVGICRFGDPQVGEAVSIEIGPSRLGGERVAWVDRRQGRRVARASIAPPSIPPSNDALVELISRSEGLDRELLEELVRRRAVAFRTQRSVFELIEKVDKAAAGGDKLDLAAELRELYAHLSA